MFIASEAVSLTDSIAYVLARDGIEVLVSGAAVYGMYRVALAYVATTHERVEDLKAMNARMESRDDRQRAVLDNQVKALDRNTAAIETIERTEEKQTAALRELATKVDKLERLERLVEQVVFRTESSKRRGTPFPGSYSGKDES